MKKNTRSKSGESINQADAIYHTAVAMLYQIEKRAIRLVGITLSNFTNHPIVGKEFHPFRRSMGTWLIKSGSNVPTAAQILGHKDHNSLK